MEHIEVENKIRAIHESLVSELKRLGAIDENGNTKDKDAFDRVLDEKIKELNDLEPLIADASGVAKDRYSANIFFHQMELLNKMRQNHTINLELNAEILEQGLQKENEMLASKPKKQVFKNGIKKLIQKFSNRKKEIENER